MAELLMTDDINAALDNIVETKLEEVRKLKVECNRCSLEISSHENFEPKLISIEEIENSLTNELDSLNDKKASLRSEIDAIWELVNKKRAEISKIKSEQLENLELRSKEVELFDDQISDDIPKFRDALRIYSEDYLTEEIQEIKNEYRCVRNDIERIDKKIYNLEKMDTTLVVPGEETALTELQGLKAFWMNLNLDVISARKLSVYSTKELEAKVEINKRKLASLV